jgi:hypothetical protein
MLGGASQRIANLKGKMKLQRIMLKNVLYVPGVQVTVISVPQLFSNDGISVKIGKNEATVEHHGTEILKFDKNSMGMYTLNESPEMNETEIIAVMEDLGSYHLWHKRLGHVNDKYVRQNVNEKNLQYSLKNFKCSTCQMEKQVQIIKRRRTREVEEILELVHSDVCGPFQTQARNGSMYFLTFIDDKSTKSSKICFKYNAS